MSTFLMETQRWPNSGPNSISLRSPSSTWAMGRPSLHNNQHRKIMNIRYKDYTITRADSLNLVVYQDHEVIATKDSKEHQKGETFIGQKFIGYYPDVFSALRGIYHREAGKGCENLLDLDKQCRSLVNELKEVVS